MKLNQIRKNVLICKQPLLISEFKSHRSGKNNHSTSHEWNIIKIDSRYFLDCLRTVILSFLKRERERFRLFASKRYSVTTWKFLVVPDRSPSLTVHRSWPFLTVPDRSWPFLTVSERFWTFHDRFMTFPERFVTVLWPFLSFSGHKKVSNGRKRSWYVQEWSWNYHGTFRNPSKIGLRNH